LAYDLLGTVADLTEAAHLYRIPGHHALDDTA
jgi:hypothetical protein